MEQLSEAINKPTTFFNGNPCKKGHVGLRRIANGECMDCSRERTAAWRAANPERLKKMRADYEASNQTRGSDYRRSHRKKVAKSMAAWRKANRDRSNAIRASYYAKHRDEILLKDRERNRKARAENPISEREKGRAYRQQNRDKLKEARRAYIEQNRAAFSAYSRSRSMAERKAMPRWVDKKAIIAVYDAALRLSDATGIKHHVDHIVPLRGKNAQGQHVVCGLHVPWNLQPMPGFNNQSKGCWV